jgi:hypothetical protein
MPPMPFYGIAPRLHSLKAERPSARNRESAIVTNCHGAYRRREDRFVLED